LHPERAELVRTPVYPATRNTVTRRETVELLPSGAARIGEQLVVAGRAAAEWRDHYQAAGERRERYEKGWDARQPGGRVVSVDMPSATELERPFEVRAVVEAPHVARAIGRKLRVTAGGRESELSRTYARLSSRKYDLVLAYPWRQDERLEFALPAGWRAERLP